MDRSQHLRYNNHEWRRVTERDPDYTPVDLNMVEFQPAGAEGFRELMFRKALGMGMTYSDARVYADTMTESRITA